MGGSRALLRDIGVLTVAQVGAQLLNVVALVVIARQVGDHWFGVLQLGVAVSMYALIAAEWGLFSLGVRAVSRLSGAAAVRDYVRGHAGLMHLLAFAVLAAGLLLTPLLPFFASDPVVFVLYLASVLPQAGMLAWVGIGLERMTWVGATKTARALFYALFVLLLLVTAISLNLAGLFELGAIGIGEAATKGDGAMPALRHLMSKNFSAPRSAPNPASVTT